MVLFRYEIWSAGLAPFMPPTITTLHLFPRPNFVSATGEETAGTFAAVGSWSASKCRGRETNFPAPC